MTDRSLSELLEEEVAAGRMDLLQAAELTSQQALFELNRSWIVQEHAGRCVGYVAGSIVVGSCEGDVLDQAEALAPDRLLYFEVVPAAAEES
ncbi:MAG: hypothetical protein ABR613_03685 [Actinomycetota bacterium]